jgi:hypothetical protein
MKAILTAFALAAAAGQLLSAGVAVGETPAAAPAPRPPIQAQFSIVLDAPIDRALAAFGPVQEGYWATGWSPRFLSRAGPDADPDYAVFQTGPDQAPMTWLLVRNDRNAHAISYVVMHGAEIAMSIDIQCDAVRPDQTRATVTYRRTALASAADVPAGEFETHIQGQGPHWQDAINAYLRSKGS